MTIISKLFFICMLISTQLWSDTPPYNWYTLSPDKKPIIQVELFLASTCPHCHKADDFFKSIQESYPWLHINRHIINKDKNDLILFNKFLTEQKMTDFAVPSIFFCNSRWVGFSSAQVTGKELLHALKFCKENIEASGKLSQSTIATLRQQSNVSRNNQIAKAPSPLKSLTLISLAETLSTCSIFGILALFGILFSQNNRKMQLQLGILFILFIGFTHFFQQLYMLLYLNILPWMRIPAALVGLFSIYLIGLHYKKKKTKAWFYFEAVLLALMIGLYQHTCALRWPYLFEKWLAQQRFSVSKYALYEFLYQFLYILPLLLILIIFLMLKPLRKLKQPNLVGLLFLGIIALILITYPTALSSMWLSFIILLIGPLSAWVLKRLKF